MDYVVSRITSCVTISFDTNLAVYAANGASPLHDVARQFCQSLALWMDVAVCELFLVELYLKLRNEKIFAKPLRALQVAAICQAYRRNRAWTLMETVPVMEDVWVQAARDGLAFLWIMDLRLALPCLRPPSLRLLCKTICVVKMKLSRGKNAIFISRIISKTYKFSHIKDLSNFLQLQLGPNMLNPY